MHGARSKCAIHLYGLPVRYIAVLASTCRTLDDEPIAQGCVAGAEVQVWWDATGGHNACAKRGTGVVQRRLCALCEVRRWQASPQGCDTAVACGRPRRGAVAAVVPRWSHDDDHLPGGRVTRDLPPPAKGHGRGAWCKRRNRTAGGRWGPHLPGQPASRLHPHALVRAAFDNVGSDRHGLWVRHADTHAQSNTPAARGLTMRRSPSIGRAEARATDATRGRLARSRRSSRPLFRSNSTALQVESTSANGRVDHSVVASRRVSRGDSTPHGVHSAGRVGARGVDSARGGGRLGAARRPGRRSTRRGESTAATTCAAATSSAGPSYGRCPSHKTNQRQKIYCSDGHCHGRSLNLEATKHQELDQESFSVQARGSCALCFGWTRGTGAMWGIEHYSPDDQPSSALGFTKAEPREGDNQGRV